MRYTHLLLICLTLPLTVAEAQTASAFGAPATSVWNGYRRIDFTLSGRACVLVVPKEAAPGRPWIWRAEHVGVAPQVDLALLERGWHVASVDVSGLYGSRRAVALFGEFYAHLVTHGQLAKRAVLAGFGSGGLPAVNFAASHPTRVAALYLDAPALDLRSWPGPGRPDEWTQCLKAHGVTAGVLDRYRGNPIVQVPALARARMPVVVVVGSADDVVPVAENTAVLEKAYRAVGAPIEVIVKPGAGHRPHGLENPMPIVEFLLRHAKW